MPKKHVETNHHVIPRSRGRDGYEIHHPINIRKLCALFHSKLHETFGNMTPQEQLEAWLKINESVITPEVYLLIAELVALHRERFYQTEVLK